MSKIAMCAAWCAIACATPNDARDGSIATDAIARFDAHRIDAKPFPSGAACPPGAGFCDDFEHGDELDPALWIANEAFVLDDSTAAEGSRSVHMRYGARYGVGGWQNIQTLPQ